MLAKATRLRTVHISPLNRSYRPQDFIDSFELALDIARQCSPTISVVGIGTRVWKVSMFLYAVGF